jgi:hypothetical protein
VANFGSLRIANTTIVGNTTTTIYGAALTTANANATINNTIVAGNPGPGGAQADVLGSGTDIVTGSNNLIGTGGSGSLVNGVNGNIVGVADPKLGPLGNHGGPTQTIPLLPGSPALDTGSNALAVDGSGNPLATDQRGLPRIFNGTVDIGAYEAQPPALSGDVNHDGKVDFSDLLILAQHYGSTTQPLWEKRPHRRRNSRVCGPVGARAELRTFGDRCRSVAVGPDPSLVGHNDAFPPPRSG